MMADNNGNSKGNGANKRMSNDKLKARRASCWARGQRRKDQRRAEQEQRRQDNLALVRYIPASQLVTGRPSVQVRYARRHGLLREVA